MIHRGCSTYYSGLIEMTPQADGLYTLRKGRPFINYNTGTDSLLFMKSYNIYVSLLSFLV